MFPILTQLRFIKASFINENKGNKGQQGVCIGALLGWVREIDI